jgi:hypothetical protein
MKLRNLKMKAKHDINHIALKKIISKMREEVRQFIEKK